MTLCLLYWYNGLDGEDSEETLLGIYANESELEAAKERYRGTDCWPVNGGDKGRFVEYDAPLGKDLYRP